jgi:hypothetical protein
MGTYQDDFKRRGIENVKLKILHANFAPDKDAAARNGSRGKKANGNAACLALASSRRSSLRSRHSPLPPASI